MRSKIKVVTMLSGIAIGDPLGGAERFGVDIARHIDRSRFEPRVCALWRFGTQAERSWLEVLESEGIRVLFGLPASVKHPLSFARALVSIAEQNGHQSIDIMHSHLPLAGLAAVLLKRRLGVRALVRTALAGHEWGDGPTSFLARQVLTNWIYPVVFDQEACVSVEMKQRFDRRPGARLVRKEVLLTYNAIDLQKFQPRGNRTGIRKDLGLPVEGLVVGSVGRLSQEKGFGDLLEAAALVRAQLPGAHFVHFGSGPLWEQLRRRCSDLGLDEVFRFLGAREDVNLLYDAMDLLVLPSHWEGLPTVILEGMACTVPVVATAIQGTRELVIDGETGWLAPVSEPVCLAQRIVEALKDPAERSRRAANARADVVPRFELDAVVRQYEAVYERVLDSKQAEPGERER